MIPSIHKGSKDPKSKESILSHLSIKIPKHSLIFQVSFARTDIRKSSFFQLERLNAFPASKVYAAEASEDSVNVTLIRY